MLQDLHGQHSVDRIVRYRHDRSASCSKVHTCPGGPADRRRRACPAHFFSGLRSESRPTHRSPDNAAVAATASLGRLESARGAGRVPTGSRSVEQSCSPRRQAPRRFKPSISRPAVAYRGLPRLLPDSMPVITQLRCALEDRSTPSLAGRAAVFVAPQGTCTASLSRHDRCTRESDAVPLMPPGAGHEREPAAYPNVRPAPAERLSRAEFASRSGRTCRVVPDRTWQRLLDTTCPRRPVAPWAPPPRYRRSEERRSRPFLRRSAGRWTQEISTRLGPARRNRGRSAVSRIHPHRLRRRYHTFFAQVREFGLAPARSLGQRCWLHRCSYINATCGEEGGRIEWRWTS